MDDILAKHLTSTFLLPKIEKINRTAVDETIIPYYSFRIIDNLFYIKTDGDIIVSETKGYWKDKPILEYNNNKYVLLKSSNNIVRIDNLGITEESITPHIINTKNKEDEISNNLLKSIKNIINSNRVPVKQKSKPIVKKEKIVKNDTFIPQQEIEDVLELDTNLDTPDPDVEINKKEDDLKSNTIRPTSNEYVDLLKQSEIGSDKKDSLSDSTKTYVDTLKGTESEATKINKKEGSIIDEESIISLLDKNKDDPRIKRLFSHYADGAKKELYNITEKYEKENKEKYIKMAHLFEGGGGTNAVQYANGGTMDGPLEVTGKLTSNYAPVAVKKVFPLSGSNEYILTHDLDTKDIVINIYDENYKMVFCDIKNISLSATKLIFSETVNNYKAIIIG